MKKLNRMKGHESTKYGQVFTEDQKKINELVDAINSLIKKVNDLESRPIGGNGLIQNIK